MKISIATVCLLIVSVIVGTAESGPHYVFLSGQISAAVSEDFYPIDTFDGDRLRLEGIKKRLRPAGNLPCQMKPIVAISNKYAEVSSFSYSFNSNRADMTELMAINEMNSEQMRFEQGQNFEQATQNGTFFGNGGGVSLEEGGGSQSFENSAQSVDELDQLSYNQSIDDPDAFGANILQDTISLRFELQPRQSIENAYAAVVLSFKEQNAQKRLQGIRRSVVRVIPIGDIESGVARQMKSTCTFPEHNIADAKVDIFLFDGNGDHVATNIAKAIKEITPEQLEKFRELEKLESAESAG